MDGQIGILRKCRYCNQWRSIEAFRGRHHQCRRCANNVGVKRPMGLVVRTRNIVLTDKGRQAAA